MKSFFLFIFFTTQLLLAQSSLSSTHGHVHTPKGHLHLLVIYVRYDNVDLMPGQPAWPNTSKKEDLPIFARGENNHLFVSDTLWFHRPDRNHNLSDYYYMSSGGKFLVTADIYPVQVPITYLNPRKGNYYGKYMQMNQAAIDWIVENDPDFDWSKYDNRTNYPSFKHDNSTSEPDGILDNVIINHRQPGSNGFGNVGNLEVAGTDYTIRSGHTAASCYADAKHNWIYDTHEFAHNLFQCPHQMGANHSDGTRFYVQKGWGMMAAWHAPFYTANAWEAWWLGWLDLQEINQSGRYRIKDYLTKRDAIRIPIPNSKDYLWIENHQKKHFWDDKQFYGDSLKDEPQVEKGIYMYVVSGEANQRENPKLSPFKKSVVNAIRMYNAEGNFDYKCTEEKESYWQVFKKGKSNPFAGQNDFQFIKADMNKDEKICVSFMHGNNDGKSCDQADIFAEKIQGKNVLTYGNTGDQNDALNIGDEVGLSGIFPVSNYPQYDRSRDSLAPYLVTGVSIKIARKYDDGSYDLNINFDDWDLRKSQRWCGTLQMIPNEDTSKIQYVNLLPNTELNVELSGTPNRQKVHPNTQKCITPTQLTVSSYRGIKVQNKAKLFVDKHSTIVFQKNSQLKVKRGGKLVVEGKLIFHDKEDLQVRGGGKVKLKGGRIEYIN